MIAETAKDYAEKIIRDKNIRGVIILTVDYNHVVSQISVGDDSDQDYIHNLAGGIKHALTCGG
jgi:hypothetical protein